jgi:hypothetical protein
MKGIAVLTVYLENTACPFLFCPAQINLKTAALRVVDHHRCENNAVKRRAPCLPLNGIVHNYSTLHNHLADNHNCQHGDNEPTFCGRSIATVISE